MKEHPATRITALSGSLATGWLAVIRSHVNYRCEKRSCGGCSIRVPADTSPGETGANYGASENRRRSNSPPGHIMVFSVDQYKCPSGRAARLAATSASTLRTASLLVAASFGRCVRVLHGIRKRNQCDLRRGETKSQLNYSGDIKRSTNSRC